MITVEEALEIILEAISTLGSEKMGLINSLGRVLAEDNYADVDIPPFNNSAMDGYAVLSSDVASASHEMPVFLNVVEDVPAGTIPKRSLRRGKAIRIMTGAPIPRGADAVIMVEKTQRRRKNVRIFDSVEVGENIRCTGEDIKRKEIVLRKGRVIGPAEMGILASLGVKTVEVAKMPRVGILATGDELVNIEEDLAPGKIRNSNTYTLFGQVKKRGAIPADLGIARDDMVEIRKKIEEGLNCDLLLISGGISVGDYDYVKEVMAGLDGSIKFWKVAMRPGKPLAFGVINDTPVFGLPGNPVSSMISFEVFVRPAILKMLGQNTDDKKEVEATLEEDIAKKRGFTYFLRAVTKWREDAYVTRTTGPQGSGVLKSMALANSLIILCEEDELLKKGAKVRVRFLS